MSETRSRADSPAAGPPAGTTGDPQAMSDRLNEFADSTLAHLDAQQAVLDRRLAALTGERFDKDLAMAGAALAPPHRAPQSRHRCSLLRRSCLMRAPRRTTMQCNVMVIDDETAV